MSRVRIRAFGPDINPNVITEKMNGFLDSSRIKYVDHTYSVFKNSKVITRSNTGGHEHFGSIAYYTRELEIEDEDSKT